jgi:hypothetical protein
VSPILVRPVREQLEHDRIIRLLQTKNRRKYDAGINPGSEQNVPVGTGPTAIYPDLVLNSPDRGRRLQAIVEVETGESVNHLEALAEWAQFARTRAAFHLYVPSTMVDVARRLCEENQITVNEIWSFHAMGDDVRFTLVHRTREAAPAPQRTAPAPQRTAPAPQRTAPPAAPAIVARRKPVPRRPLRSAKASPRGRSVKKATRSPKRK